MNNPNYEPKPADKTPEERAVIAFIRLALKISKSEEPIRWRPVELWVAATKTDEFNDDAVGLIYGHTDFKSEDEITKTFAILEEHRPELSDRINPVNPVKL